MKARDRRIVAIRGATTVERDTAAHITDAVGELVREIVRQNDISPAQVVSAQFTATADLVAAFPSSATRLIDGWADVPLLCAQAVSVTDGLPRCIRLLLTIERDPPAAEVRHVYLREARGLRPDLQ